MLVQIGVEGYLDRVEAVTSTLDTVPSELRHNDFGVVPALRGLRERGYYPRVIFDVGAAIGNWTGMALEFWPDSQYYLFEVLEERRGSLEELIRQTATKMSILIGGVGDIDGELPLGVTEGLFDSSLAYQGTQSRQVDCYRLDTLYSQGKIEKPNFVKMDVQGYELNILAGAGEVLSECSVILMECQFFKFCDSMNTLDKTIKVMSDLDFVPYEFVDFLRRPLDGAMGQCDFLFVKRGHWLISDNKWG